MRRLVYILIAAILVLGLTAGCSITGTTTPSGGQTTSGSDPAATTGESTATPVQTTAAVETTAVTGTSATTTAPVSSIYFQPLPEDQACLYDLDNNGTKESFVYNVVDDYRITLTLNGTVTSLDGEMFLTGWFFLTDLDRNDNQLDLAIQELGPSDDYTVTFYYFNGSKLVSRGTVPGTICDPYADDIGNEAYGLGSITLNGAANLIAQARGNVLHTWFYDEPWRIAPGGKLEVIPQTYIPMFAYDSETGERLSETPVTLKVDLPLFNSPDASSDASLLARAGETAALVKTDNTEWVQLRNQAGQLGWFRLGDGGYSVIVGDSELFSEEVFEGLSFAD